MYVRQLFNNQCSLFSYSESHFKFPTTAKEFAVALDAILSSLVMIMKGIINQKPVPILYNIMDTSIAKICLVSTSKNKKICSLF